jgi:hypothetical protein
MEKDRQEQTVPQVTLEALEWQLERSLGIAKSAERQATIAILFYLWLCSLSIVANLSVTDKFDVNFLWVNFELVNGALIRILAFGGACIALIAYFFLSNVQVAQQRSLAFFAENGSEKVIALLAHAGWMKQREKWVYTVFPLLGFAMIVGIFAMFGIAAVTLIMSLRT